MNVVSEAAVYGITVLPAASNNCEFSRCWDLFFAQGRAVAVDGRIERCFIGGLVIRCEVCGLKITGGDCVGSYNPVSGRKRLDQAAAFFS